MQALDQEFNIIIIHVFNTRVFFLTEGKEPMECESHPHWKLIVPLKGVIIWIIVTLRDNTITALYINKHTQF